MNQIMSSGKEEQEDVKLEFEEPKEQKQDFLS